MRKLILFLVAMVLGLLMSACASLNWHKKLQNDYFDENGNRAGYSADRFCTKQAMKEVGYSYMIGEYGQCAKDPKCRELAETCMEENGFTLSKQFETTAERMALYQKAYEENWIKPGMTRLEVISLIGAPQIITIQLSPPRKIWIYCRNAAKTAFIGYNFIFQVTWDSEGKVESAQKVFKIG
jgi:hypothetical protein